jgi:hypothetical protein
LTHWSGIDWDGLGQRIDPHMRTGHGLAALAHLSDTGLLLSADLALVRRDVAQDYGTALRVVLIAGADRTPKRPEIDMGKLAADLRL